MGDSQRAVTLAILAGGEGSRMGRPKAELEIDGRPILVHLIEQIAWSGPTLLVTTPGRQHPPGFECFDREVADPVAGKGPLRGVLTALERSETERIVVATVDMPAISAEPLLHVARLLDERPACHAMMLRRHGSRDDSVEPFPAAYRQSATEIVRAQLESGAGAVRALCRHAGIEVATAPSGWPSSIWTNLNTPSDLDDYLRRIVH